MSLTWPSLSRELLRLWLRSEEKAYALPLGLRDDWQHLYYSLTSAEQDFFPPESTLSSRMDGEKRRRADVNASHGGRPSKRMLGAESSQQLPGAEWAKRLLGAGWSKNLLGAAWGKSEPGFHALLGREWLAQKTQAMGALLGREWLSQKTQAMAVY